MKAGLARLDRFSLRSTRVETMTVGALLDTLPVGVCVQNHSGAIVRVNRAAVALLGLPCEDILGRDLAKLLSCCIRADGTLVPEIEIPPAQALATRACVADVVLGYLAPSTSERTWLQVTSVPAELGDAPSATITTTLIGMKVPLAIEVCEGRRTLLDLQSSGARLERLLDALPGLVYQYRLRRGGHDRFEFVSNQVVSVLGLEVEQVLADPRFAWSRVHADDLASFRDSISASARHSSVWEHEFRYHKPDGTTCWLRGRAIPIRTEDETLWTGVLFDVTETHDMAERLKRAQRREAMASLSAGVAHNFNNMLAAILPNLDVALAQATPAASAALLDARNATVSAGDLVRRLLMLGRPDPEGTSNQSDLVRVVQGALDICRRTFDSSIQITADMDVQCAPVRGRSSDLQQVVLNLCLNARDALVQHAHPALRVSVSKGNGALGTEPLDHHFVLVVQDNGGGMTPQTLQRLGEPFFTTKGPGGGTGLGLATILRTVADLEGRVHVDTDATDGTRFEICLRAAPDVQQKPTLEVPAVETPVAGCILVVDDESLVRSSLCRVLQAAGFSTLEAARGDQAVEMLAALPEAHRDALTGVLLDLSLPGLSGTDVLLHICTHWPRLKVVVLSGHVPNPERLLGAAGVLEKPIGGNALVAALRSILLS